MKSRYNGQVEHLDYRDHRISIKWHQDDCASPPWKECDCYGEVSEWTTRDKRPGEWVLTSDRGSKRYYDHAGTMRKAAKEGWGISDEEREKLAKSKGKSPDALTRGEIVAQAVQLDFERLKGWCDDDWTYLFYTVEITHPGGDEINYSDSLGMIESDYAAELEEEAYSQAKSAIDERIDGANSILMALCSLG